jgi:hypothetical protein
MINHGTATLGDLELDRADREVNYHFHGGIIIYSRFGLYWCYMLHQYFLSSNFCVVKTSLECHLHLLERTVSALINPSPHAANRHG